MSRPENVLMMSFDEPGRARAGLDTLRRLDERRTIELEQAVVLERDRTGELKVVDAVDTAPAPNRAVGGLLGLILGPADGPAGVLAGQVVGSVAGGIHDRHRQKQVEAAVEHLGHGVRAGAVLLVAAVRETQPDPVDRELQQLGGAPTRVPLGRFHAEIDGVTDSSAS